LPVAFVATSDPDGLQLSLDVEEALYRIAQEALHNVVRHAQAQRVEVTLTIGQNEAELQIADDGVGFDASAVAPGHLGLDGMRIRAERLGGTFEVESAPGVGSRLSVTIPISADSA
jgi:signal transduction histidine kinase